MSEWGEIAFLVRKFISYRLLLLGLRIFPNSPMKDHLRKAVCAGIRDVEEAEQTAELAKHTTTSSSKKVH
jgi:hypothetical protein